MKRVEVEGWPAWAPELCETCGTSTHTLRYVGPPLTAHRICASKFNAVAVVSLGGLMAESLPWNEIVFSLRLGRINLVAT